MQVVFVPLRILPDVPDDRHVSMEPDRPDRCTMKRFLCLVYHILLIDLHIVDIWIAPSDDDGSVKTNTLNVDNPISSNLSACQGSPDHRGDHGTQPCCSRQFLEFCEKGELGQHTRREETEQA